jgi:CBS domain-containing protein
MCFAVLVREIARSIAAAYAGLHLRAVLLLPVGGIMAFSSRDGAALSASDGKLSTRLVTTGGPVANFAVGLLLLGFSLSINPHLSLLAQPWISLGHILRSVIWMQVVLGAVSLLPAPVMPSLPLPRTASGPGNREDPAGAVSVRDKLSALGPAVGLGNVVAIALMIAGIALPNLYWLIVLGAFMLLMAQVNNLQTQAVGDGDAILVREVMLTEYTLLSSSDTLQGALDRTVHSLQDVFPVVRGDRLVGSIARQTIAARLYTDGDSYLQGAMMRNLQIATPSEKLAEALRRATTLGASEFIPVVEDNTMIGILTPQSLARAVQQVKLLRPVQPPQREQP